MFQDDRVVISTSTPSLVKAENNKNNNYRKKIAFITNKTEIFSPNNEDQHRNVNKVQFGLIYREIAPTDFVHCKNLLKYGGLRP